MTPDDSFEGNIARWREYQQTPWARLYYRISRANLAHHLPESGKCLKLLDVGGGNGVDAIAYAGMGYAVTLVDPSAEMLAEAGLHAQDAGVAERINLQRADLASVPTLFPQAAFDVVLCHSVAHYVDDAAQLLDAICCPLRVGGLLSLTSINRYSEAFRDALFWQNPLGARAKLDSRTSHSTVFDTPIQLRTASEFIELLPSVDCELLAQYGIRCVNDYIPDNEIKSDPDFYAQLEQLEMAMSGRYPYYLLARNFQIVARKLSTTSASEG